MELGPQEGLEAPGPAWPLRPSALGLFPGLLGVSPGTRGSRQPGSVSALPQEPCGSPEKEGKQGSPGWPAAAQGTSDPAASRPWA